MSASTLQAISGREASIFACLTDTVVCPEPLLPPVRETDTVEAFDNWMARMPTLNRRLFRVLLHVVELAPLLAGFGARLRQLDSAQRAAFLDRTDHAKQPQIRQLSKLLQGFGQLSYYGDDNVMRQIGYDADANIERARELREREGRM